MTNEVETSLQREKSGSVREREREIAPDYGGDGERDGKAFNFLQDFFPCSSNLPMA